MAGNDDIVARLNGWADAIRRFDIAAAHTLNEGATALAERYAQIERLKAGKESAATEIVRLVKERDEAHANHQWAQARLDQAESRATTAERDLAEARAEVERKDAALRQIASWEPATQEITVANMMAAEARAALAKGCADGQS